MAEAQAAEMRDMARAAAGTAVALAVAGLVGVVFERLGAPGPVIAGLATALVLLVIAVAGLTGGTMRFPVFLTAGRTLSPLAGGFAIGGATTTAFGGDTLSTAAGLVLAALVVAPALRRSGMPGLAGWLGWRFSDPLIRTAAALSVVAVAVLAAAARLADIGVALVSGLGLAPVSALALAAGACAIVVLPCGLRGAVRGALCAAVVALAALPVAISPGALGAAAAQASGSFGTVAWLGVAAAMLAPHVAVAASACRSPSDARLSVLAAAAVVVVFGIVLAAGPAPGRLFGTVGAVALRLSLDLAAAVALVAAAGLALGFELRGRLDRRRRPMSRRFATLRLATAAIIVAAAWLAAQDPARLAGAAGIASVILVATVGPPLIIGLATARGGRWSGLLACVGGLATAALLLEGRLAPDVTHEGAALAGLAAGLLAGLLPVLFVRARPLPPPVDDASL